MKKRLTEAQFQAAIKGLEVGQQTIDIARGVLVEGVPQASFVTSLNLSRGAVSQAVHRVWASHEERNLPEGYERVTAVLPEHQAFIVKKWAIEAAKKTEPHK
ncbi:transcriptional regulator [Xanthomonas citri pv. citri]|uniref:transcriptional regulator KorA n=1 Tax=Xanthomonas TaxID=338 RepID=UPI0004743A88|nr:MULTISPECIES: transcriptional regulator KorA [Xanthomonas]MBD1524580.1 transcriptional regulator [Xanthomonas citri pv. citri]KEZ96769.1 transcriptional regulator [Xanthomonas vasicola pv. vasculorum NCPPB 895]MBV7306587.1 transcriptional regulator KorA [Xanthomonas vasicola pv. vasculorum]MDO6936099.1 transcriptional regulator KorA [Xanthomonas vasicola]MDO6940003.1 transcriptional regulator KorA [Xanthomonas vasicola]